MLHRKPGLATKKVSISCARTADALHLDIIETHTYIDPATDPLHQAFYRKNTDVSDYLELTLAMFSRIQHNSNAASALSKSFIIFSKGAIIKDSFKHQRNEHAVRLHANTPQLLVLLGCIDNVLQHVKYHEHYDGFDITFYFKIV